MYLYTKYYGKSLDRKHKCPLKNRSFTHYFAEKRRDRLSKNFKNKLTIYVHKHKCRSNLTKLERLVKLLDQSYRSSKFKVTVSSSKSSNTGCSDSMYSITA